MQALTEDGRRLVENLANRHGVSTDAVTTLLMSLAVGGGRQAQFNHWELGGMGQWSQGGMIMIGDMFNNGLKHRVDALCNDLSVAMQTTSLFAPPPLATPGSSQSQSSGFGQATGTSFFNAGSFGNRWPTELGHPSSTGSQNDLHYAVFPETRRLALDQGGHVTVYDTGDHHISGFAQAQGGGQSITLTSQYGLVRLSDLPQVPLGGVQAAAPELPGEPSFAAPGPFAEPSSQAACATPVAPQGGGTPSAITDDEIFSRIERLADLRQRDIITAEEFDAKKAELLARL